MAQMLFDVHDVVVLGQWWKKLHGVSRPRTERFLLSVLSSEKAGRKERLCLFPSDTVCYVIVVTVVLHLATFLLVLAEAWPGIHPGEHHEKDSAIVVCKKCGGGGRSFAGDIIIVIHVVAPSCGTERAPLVSCCLRVRLLTLEWVGVVVHKSWALHGL